MTDPLSRELNGTSWPRELSAAERAKLNEWLASHPEARAEWELDEALSRQLDALRDAPVPGNFTARVLDAIERDERAQVRRPSGQRWSWRWWLPRVAFAAVAVGVGGFAYDQHRVAERAERARHVATLSAVVPVPAPEVLQNMDLIRQLEPSLEADVELIALFQ